MNLFVAKIVNICDKNKKNYYITLMKQMTLTTEEDYIKASKRLMEIFQTNPNTQEGKELVELIAPIKEYDEKQFKL
jgi:hypothetical protein